MGSLHSRCPPAETITQQEENGNCIPKLLNHFGEMFSRTACPHEKDNSRVTRQLVNSIECEPLRQGETEGQSSTVYKVIEEKPIKQHQQCGQWMHKGFIVALVLTFLSLGINYVMWLTNAYDNAVLKLVSIRNDIDTVFEMWKMPPTKTQLSIYIFNYTNHNEWVKGEVSIPHVEEVGPFVFREQMERINVHFNDNDTVSFQEKKKITYVPELSAIPLNATLWVPNILVIAAMKIQFQKNAFFVEQKVVDQLFQSITNFSIFKNITVNESIWGFQDEVLNFFSSSSKPTVYGFLAARQGEHHDILTMKTGSDDLSKIGLFTRWNGKDKIGAWGNTVCDEIEGSDGTIFPVKSIQEKKPLHIFLHGMCRRLPIFFNKSTTSVDGFPVQQYNVHEEMFNYHKDVYSCFEKDGKHAPDGVFDTSPCNKGAPLYASFPHFWKGGDMVKQNIQGLHPDAEKHRSYFQIHKDLGICLLAKMRFQLNIKLEKYRYMKSYTNLKQDEIILPFGWLDFDSGELPPHFVNVLYHLTYTVKTVKEILKFTFLFVFIISLAFVSVFVTRKIRRSELMDTGHQFPT